MTTPPVAREAVEIIEKKLNLALTTYLEACTHCGLCADACHLYRADPVTRHMPVVKADTVRKVYQRYFTPLGRLFPWLYGVRDLTEKGLDGWVETSLPVHTLPPVQHRVPAGDRQRRAHRHGATGPDQAGQGPPLPWSSTRGYPVR